MTISLNMEKLHLSCLSLEIIIEFPKKYLIISILAGTVKSVYL